MPDINIVLSAQDNASGTINTVKSSISGLGQAAGGTAKTGLQQISGVLGGALTTALTVGGSALAGLATTVGVTGINFDNMKEQAQIAFTTMLGDGGKAKTFLDDLQKFAAKTPFEFPELVQASQRMLAMGFASEDVMPSLTAIGDAVAGLGGSSELVGRVTTALGQMQAKGKASGEEMMQLTEAGIPAWEILAKAIGTDVAGAMDAVSDGSVSADTAITALVDGMNTKFGGLMEKQSATFGGLLSTLKDTFSSVSGEVMAPLFEVLTDGLSSVVEWTSKPEFAEGVKQFSEWLSVMMERGIEIATTVLPKIWEGVTSLWEIVKLLVTGEMDGSIFGLSGDDPFIMALLAARDAAQALWDVFILIAQPVIDAVAGFVSLQDILTGAAIVIGVVAVNALIGLLAAMAPIVLTVGAIILAVATLRNAWEGDWGGIRTATETALSAIQERFSPVVDAIRTFGGEALEEIKAWATGNGTEFSAVNKIWEETKTAVTGLFQDIGSAITTWGAPVVTWFETTFPGAAQLLREAWAGVSKEVGELWTAIQNAFGTGSVKLSEVMANIERWWKEHGDEVRQIVDNFLKVVIALLEVAVKTFTNVLTLFFQVITGDWDGAWNTLKEIFSDIWTAIQTILDVAIENFKLAWSLGLGEMLSNATNKWDEIKQAVSGGINGVMTAIGTFATDIVTNIGKAWTTIVTNAGNFAVDIVSELAKGWTNATNAVNTKWDEIKTAIANKFKDIVTNATTFATNIVRELATGWTNAVNAVNTKWEEIKTAIGNKFTDLVTKATTFATDIVAAVAKGWVDILTAVGTKWEEIKTAVSTKFTEMVNMAKTKATELVTGFVEGLVNFKTQVETKIAEVIKAITDPFANIYNTLKTAGENVINGFKAGIEAKWTELTTAASNLGNLIPDTVSGLLDQNSPSEVMKSIGQNTVLGFNKGIEDKTRATLDTATNLTRDFLEKFDVIMERLPEVSEDAVADFVRFFQTGMRSAVNSAVSLVSDFTRKFDVIMERLPEVSEDAMMDFIRHFKTGFASVLSSTQTFVSNLVGEMSRVPGEVNRHFQGMVQQIQGTLSPATFQNIGSNVVGGFIGGINSRIQEAISAAQSLAASVPDTVTSMLGIASPSEELKGLGQDTVLGFEHGVDSRIRDAAAVSQNVVNAVMARFDQLMVQLPNVAQEAMSRFTDGIQAAMANLTSVVGRMIDQVMARVNQMPAAMQQVSQQLAQTQAQINQTIASANSSASATSAAPQTGSSSAAQSGIGLSQLSNTGLVENLMYMFKTGDFPGKSASLPFYEDSRVIDAILKLGPLANQLMRDGEYFNAIKNYFGAIVEDQDYRNDWITHIPAEAQDMFRNVGQYLAAEIKTGLQAGLQIHSPSRYFAWIGEMSAKGFAQGYARGSGAGGAQSVSQDNRQLIVNVHGGENLAQDVRNNVELYAMAYGFN